MTTILIIDPDNTSKDYLSSILSKSGYDTKTAADGQDGLALAKEYGPEIILIDSSLAGIRIEDLATQLRQDKSTMGSYLIALSHRSDNNEKSFLFSKGFNEYLVKSNQTIPHLLELIPHLIIPQENKPAKKGFLFVFLSAKGGVGTSSLCANLAMVMGKNIPASKVAVIDMVLPVGSIANIVGYDKNVNLATVSSLETSQTDDAYYYENLDEPLGWNFRILAGCPNPDSANQLVVNRLEEIVFGIRNAFDYILVDIGRSLSKISLPIIQQADLITLVLSNDATAVALTRTILNYMRSQKVEDKRVYPLLNRAVGLEGLTKSEAEEKLGLQIRATIPYMGGNFTLANNRHEPIMTKFPGDSASLELNRIASEMVEISVKLRDQGAYY